MSFFPALYVSTWFSFPHDIYPSISLPMSLLVSLSLLLSFLSCILFFKYVPVKRIYLNRVILPLHDNLSRKNNKIIAIRLKIPLLYTFLTFFISYNLSTLYFSCTPFLSPFYRMLSLDFRLNAYSYCTSSFYFFHNITVMGSV